MAVKKIKIGPFSAFLVALILHLSGAAESATPIATDSRIRTFVYGENEVFKINVFYGYQTIIEFARGEKVTTISLGNPSLFKITPSGNRIFLKSFLNDKQTNMTVITNLRVYYFDLSSKKEKDDDIMYVVRFYYPEENFDNKIAREKYNDVAVSDFVPAIMPNYPMSVQKSDFARPLVTESVNNVSTPLPVPPATTTVKNYNYSFTGPDESAPLQIFDDGTATYVKFPESTKIPAIYSVDDKGVESPLPFRKEGNYIVVMGVLPRLALHTGPDIVCVFNDNIVPQAMIN